MTSRFAVLAALILSASCAAVKPEPAQEIVVLSYNIHHGQGNDGEFDLERLAQVIRASGADLVALQEVDQNTLRCGGVDQVAELARLTGMYGVFGAAMPYDGGSYGEGILSRWPVLESEVIPLSAQPDHEPRAAVAVVVQAPGSDTRVRFVGTHLDHTKDDRDRRAQVSELRLHLELGLLPTLLVGDLNSMPGSAPMELLLSAGWTPADPLLQPTYPAEGPSKKIDWILSSPHDSGVLHGVEVLWEPVASDHSPLLARWVIGGTESGQKPTPIAKCCRLRLRR
jgi:endonuclease/exonuclease/phosphatase family metal-dependent hydrolase